MTTWFETAALAARQKLDATQQVLDDDLLRTQQCRLQGPSLFLNLVNDLISAIDLFNSRFPAEGTSISSCSVNAAKDEMEFGRRTFPSVSVTLSANFRTRVVKCVTRTWDTVFSAGNPKCIVFQLQADDEGKLGFFSDTVASKEEIVEMLMMPFFRV